MAEPASKTRKVDPFIALAVLFFLLAVALAMAPALNAGPETLASMLLLVGLAGVCTGLFVLRGPVETPTETGQRGSLPGRPGRAGGGRRPGRAPDPPIRPGGGHGPAPRLPKSGAAASAPVRGAGTARRGELGRANLKVAGLERALVSPIGSRRPGAPGGPRRRGAGPAVLGA